MENEKLKLTEKVNMKIKEFFIKDVKMKMLVVYLTLNLGYLLIGSYFYFTENIIKKFHYKEFSYGLKYLFIVNVIVFLVILIKKKYKKNYVHIGIAFAIFFGIISVIFAFDKKIALNGCWGRYEGLFSILYYLTLMLLSTFVSKKYKRFLVKSILLSGVIQALYAICQCFNLFNVKLFWNTYKYYDETIKTTVVAKNAMILGFTNNSNFLGAYMLLCLSYSIGLVIDSKKIRNIIFYCILTALFMFVILISNTASAFLSLMTVGIYILIFVIKNKLFKKMLIVFIIIISTTVITVVIGKTRLLKDISKIGNEAIEVVKGNFDDNFGTKRMYIWKNTLKIIPQYWWHGVGIDCFHKAFDGKALTRVIQNKNVLYDKAHNEYLQTLITQGAFALTAYLIIYGYAVYVGIKNSYKTKEIYLVLPVIGYLVQAFFNISVIEVAPIFYMALGLCCEDTSNIKSLKLKIYKNNI